jgi:hypothetical protein
MLIKTKKYIRTAESNIWQVNICWYTTTQVTQGSLSEGK